MERFSETPETQAFGFNPEFKVRDDITTWVAEVLDGNMRTVFEYSFDGKELYGRDGRALGPIFSDAINDAATTAKDQPNLAFEVRRRGIEQEEYGEMVAMAKGELPDGINTIVVVSDFPPELMEAAEDVGGYNSTRKQTMLRVITKDETGKLKIYSQNLDGSNRKALEGIYTYFGEDARDGELLGQRIHRDLPSEEQEFLVDWLMGVYDRSMAEQFGGTWLGGRRPAEEGNTYEFVCAQEDLLSAYEADVYMYGQPSNALRYSIAAAMRERFENADLAIDHQKLWSESGYSLEMVNYEMEQAALRAVASGKSFSGCGMTVESDVDPTTLQELKESGYGNKTDSETKYAFDKKMHCVVCQPKPKDNEPKKMCGPCGICQQCDKKLSKK